MSVKFHHGGDPGCLPARFASPVGYQTHMMVFGPGGYRFTDFVRVGIPLNLLMGITAVILIPLIWPF